MKSNILWILVSTALLVVLACGQPQEPKPTLTEGLEGLVPAVPEPPALSEAAPAFSSLVFSNQFVRAATVELPAGAAIPEHHAGYRLLQANSDLEIAVTADEETSEFVLTDGQIVELPEGNVAMTNFGESPARFLAVSRTDAEMPENAVQDHDPDPVPEIEETADATFISRHFLVYEFDIEPGASAALDNLLPRMLYFRTPCELALSLPGTKEPISMSPEIGDAEWLTAKTYTVVNTGDSVASFSVFGLRE